jgi:tripartite-type tricarboxylate transporter receptor subunit TctC
MIQSMWRAAVAGLLALLAAAPASAAYPEKTVRIIVPYPAGGTSDLLARLVAPRLSERLGQQFIIDNRSGASGSIGSAMVAKAEPDGHTLLLGTISTHGINSSVQKDLPYDAVKDFAPVTIIGSTPNVLSVHPSLPVQTLGELVALAKAKPGSLNFGSTSPGGSPHMSGELLKMMAKIDIVHVPYRGGGPMLNDLIAGQIQMGFDNLPSSMGHIRAGSIRPIAITTAQRWPNAPEIPTMRESGLPEYEVSAWFGLLAPAKTPPETVALLYRNVAEILKRTEVEKQLLELGAEPGGNTPQAFAKQIENEVVRWRRVVEATGATAE